MNNKYVISRNRNVSFVKQHLDTFIANNMSLSRYSDDDPLKDKAYRNFQNAYDFILNSPDVENDYHCLLKLHEILMEGLDERIKSELNEQQIAELSEMINQPAKANTEIAIDVMMYILEKRLFSDGDVRAALLFADKIMIDNGCGFITVSQGNEDVFRKKLDEYKNNNDFGLKEWIYMYCIKGPKTDY